VASGDADRIDVEQRDDEHRFVVARGGLVAELTYHRDGERLVLDHDGVPEALSGQGVGSALVRAAVDVARASGLTLVPRCPFARRWLREHPELTDGVAIDWH
jgi:predicted GNAT family acetyltransferase